MDVLLVESRPEVGMAAERALRAAGHHVHRCHEPGDRAFPCKGVVDRDGCPIDHGVDVALLVRDHVSPRPSPLEDGVSCAIRADVPLVHHGPEALDPFEQWVSGRVEGDDVVGACASAADRAYDPVRRDIAEKAGHLLAEAGISADDLVCHVRRDGAHLRVELSGPPIDKHLQQALSVRVIDAVRGLRRPFDQVDVGYRPVA